MSLVAESLGRIMLPQEPINVEYGCNNYAYDYHGNRGRFRSQCDLLENMAKFHVRLLLSAISEVLQVFREALVVFAKVHRTLLSCHPQTHMQRVVFGEQPKCMGTNPQSAKGIGQHASPLTGEHPNY